MANPFTPDYERYEGVRPFHIYALRTLFLLMFLFVGFDAWSTLLGHQGPWDSPTKSAAWCMFAGYSTLSILGVFRPLKMLPIILFMVVYKTIWLGLIAYPLWSAGKLAGSPFEGMANVFRWVVVAYFAVPWGYVFRTYVLHRVPSAPPARTAPQPAR